jgi:NAD(P)-dependent dehydrogenase (short-subunit alcohol dehydrogenase family)
MTHQQASGIALVTGASRGIGAAVARLLAARGMAVAVNYLHNAQAAQALMSEIHAQGGKAVAIQGDVAVEADVMRLFAEVDAQLGRLTVLVNNTGVLDRQCRVENMSVERIQRIFNTNVLGSFVCCREAVKRMSTQHGGAGGAIVNLSSRASALGAPGEYVDYAASKGAVDTLTIGLAKEVAGVGIRVNAVRPGIIETDIHASGGEPGRAARIAPLIPMLRSGTAEEVAQCIVWLASPESSYVTGALLDIGGGR